MSTTVRVTDLEAFVRLAESAGTHLTATAEELRIPQPTLTRRIRRVEEAAGAPLFDRGARGSHGMRLNGRGRAYLPHARAAVAELAAGKALVHRLMDPELGTVRLDFMHSLGTWLVPSLLRGYRGKHPQVVIELHQGAALELIRRVQAEQSDVALVGPAPALAEDSAARAPLTAGTVAEGVEWHPLLRQRLALAVPEDHALAVARGPIALADAAAEPFIGMLPGYGTRILLDRLAAAAGFEPRFVFESMELTTVMGLVSAGLGVALMPMDDPYLAPSGVVLRPLAPPAHRELGIVSRAGDSAPPVVQFWRYIIAAPAVRRWGTLRAGEAGASWS